MEVLETVLSESPGTKSVNLEFLEIEDFDELIPCLTEFRNLEEILLFGNRLTNLPRDLSILSKVKYLDLSNNLIKSVDDIIEGLASLPNLTHLSITLTQDSDKTVLCQYLRKLEFLNGEEVTHEQIEEPQEENPALIESQIEEGIDYPMSEDKTKLRQADLERIGKIYDKIRELHRTREPGYDKRLSNLFDSKVQSVMEELAKQFSGPQPAHIVHTHIISAKLDLYGLCMEKAIEYVETLDPRVSEVLEGIHGLSAELYGELPGIILDIQPLFQDKITALKADLDKSMRETAEILEAAEQLENENKNLLKQKETVGHISNREREELQLEIESLQEENKRYLETIIKKSKNSAEAVLENPGRPGTTNKGQSSRTPGLSMPNISSDISRITPDISRREDLYRTNATNLPQSRREEPPRANTSMSQSQFGGSAPGRVLSLKQLKDTIEEIYASKTRFDQKCSDNKLPRETMEQHMYTFLNQKYGLKNLIIEWASAIINGIKKFSIEDNDVAVFGKQLRNEWDEEFRFVQKQVKETVAELLKMHLKGKYPLKTNNDVRTMFNEKVNGSVLEEEWVDIVKYMYNETDSDILIGIVNDYIRSSQAAQHAPAAKKKLTREEALAKRENDRLVKGRIVFSEFLKILLDFQLQGHEKFLSNFLNLFKSIDADNNGIITEGQFRDLVVSLGFAATEEDLTRLLQIVDPFGNEQTTFSECVSTFSSEMIEVEGQMVSILQNFALQGFQFQDN